MYKHLLHKGSLKVAAAAIVLTTTGTTEFIAFSSPINPSASKDNKKVVIVGGGAAGVGVSSMLKKEGIKDITIIEPSKKIYYQPLWTLVGGGQANELQSADVSSVVNKDVKLIPKAVTKFNCNENTVSLSDGSTIEYDYLVVATGIQINWGKVTGLQEALNKKDSGVVSIYDGQFALNANNTFKNVNGGRLIFTFPSTPIKCAGAPQKVMWLVEEALRDKKKGIRDNTTIDYYTAGGGMFGVKKYSDMLDVQRKTRNINAVFKQELVSVDAEKKIATFKNLDDNTLTKQHFDVLHVAPPMGAPDVIRDSPLAATSGYVDVDKHTLQSTKYSNVFGIGDCISTPNSKTFAAISSQAPVLVHNLLHAIDGKKLDGVYEGYASCPLVVGKKHTILAEFGYDGKIMETFSSETGKFPYSLLGQENYLAQHVIFPFFKSTLFPYVFWNYWMQGNWYGSSGFFKPNVVKEMEL